MDHQPLRDDQDDLAAADVVQLRVFDIERRDNHHLAFGIGEHFCIGTHLARLETRVMFEGILERMRDIELAGPVSYLRSNLIDGVKHIPLKFAAR